MIRPGTSSTSRRPVLPAGTYTLSFTADSDPTTHTAQFVVPGPHPRWRSAIPDRYSAVLPE